MDGTLVDSIAAVEAAWTSVANELGQPAEDVIAATHGRRAIDNLKDLKPQLRRLTNEQMEPHVEEVSRRNEIPDQIEFLSRPVAEQRARLTVREAYPEGSR